MSRWVCVDDICIPSDENDWEELVAFADAIAEQEPIEVIRCRECKHFGEDSVGTYCDRYKCTMKPDDFCSYGERSDQ